MKENEEYKEITELLGATLVSCTGKVGDDEIVLKTNDGRIFKLFYEVDGLSPEYFTLVNEVCGDLDDLVGSIITQAEESIKDVDRDEYEILTCTFYRLSTAKGQVVIRFGENVRSEFHSNEAAFVEIV